MQDHKLKVFLCHASQDKPIVRELSQRLNSEGWIDAWLDEAKLLPGQDWRSIIEEAVETSDVVIVCLSNHSVNKEGFVQKEMKYAKEIALEKPEETIFLIPLRLDDCAVPRGFRLLQWADYFPEKREDAYRALLQSLRLRYQQKVQPDGKGNAFQRDEVGEISNGHPDNIERNTASQIRPHNEAINISREFPPSIPRTPTLEGEDKASRGANTLDTYSRKGHLDPIQNRRRFSKWVSWTLVAFLILALAVIVAAVTSYMAYGRNIQYEGYINGANNARAQAQNLTDPVEQRKAWENVLIDVEHAESVYKTSETSALRNEANANLDNLLGITRLQFSPAFSTNLGITVSRMAASETDLYLLNAETGAILRAEFTNGRGFQIDTSFSCAPGVYGGYTVGPLVDILAMPALNSINATVLGIDAAGNLLYCAPNQVAQAIPLPPPDTNWNRVTAFVLDSGNLYVLDAMSRAVWVYTGMDGTFVDRPYFFFGGQTPEKQDVIDLLVVGDELYMLHSDGHLSNCSYSRIETKPTQCTDPATLTNPFPAYQDTDLFGTAHITQIFGSAPPDTSLLLLSADDQAVFRITPRSFELQNQMKPASIGTSSPVPAGPVDSMTVAPNHVLYLAIAGQVYFATGMP